MDAKRDLAGSARLRPEDRKGEAALRGRSRSLPWMQSAAARYLAG
jgi:hypothetical protein